MTALRSELRFKAWLCFGMAALIVAGLPWIAAADLPEAQVDRPGLWLAALFGFLALLLGVTGAWSLRLAKVAPTTRPAPTAAQRRTGRRVLAGQAAFMFLLGAITLSAGGLGWGLACFAVAAAEVMYLLLEVHRSRRRTSEEAPNARWNRP